ncbi:MAG: FAD-dependent oxidoreductase [Gemmatimonadetes bacterium]|nr:FAD-dependent oxidoreductase [Gemmatimonadota bacterium]
MRRVVIVGAGPTGLGAAHRLQELGHDDFILLEGRSGPGGLASSEVSRNGFTYDIGGHVLFSHFRYFDELFDRVLGDEYQELQREAWVWMMDRFLPYPFQNNIKHLPRDVVLACVLGAIEAQARERAQPFTSFEELIYGVFGKGMAEAFMMPYNFKVWAHPPRMMGTGWIGERVPVVNLERVLGNVIHDRDDLSWGPNNTFKYPLHGGTGGLFERVAARVDGRIRYESQVVGIDARRKRLRLADGQEEEYEQLISTMPLDLLVGLLGDAPTAVTQATQMLLHSGSAVVGVGVRQPCPSSKCWMYFPEPDCPFYRVTYLSNYSPEVVPDARTHYSLLAEVSRSVYKPVSLTSVVEEVLDGFVNTRLLSPADLADVVDTHLIVREYTYPIPTLRRDEALAVIQPYLESFDIYSRGRFGAWKYEIGNMDHSVQMGVECAERLVRGTPELCFRDRILPKSEQELGLLPETVLPPRPLPAGVRAGVRARRRAAASA